MTEKISNWSNNKIYNAKIYKPKNYDDIKKIIKNKKKYITSGKGYNYGDSTFSKNIISLETLNKKINLNYKDQEIECSSQTTLNEILDVAETKRLTLAIMPGSGNVTLGGAIAADVHGKNHVKFGSFCNYLSELTIMCSNGKILKCSEKKNQDLFRATCGGMGLTGIILSAKIKLIKLKSNTMKIQNYFFYNYQDLIKFLLSKNSVYSITWVDYYSINRNNIRAIYSDADFSNYKNVKKNNLKIPNFVTGLFFNTFIMKYFNLIFFYLKRFKKISFTNYRNFLLPFDYFSRKKKFYGKYKIIQIQIIIKKKDLKLKLFKFLSKLKELKMDCFLIGIKKFGKRNNNVLSFPEEGFTITFDLVVNKENKKKFKILTNELFNEKLKVYLTKDILINDKLFFNIYPNAKKFLNLKKKYDKSNKFYSSLYSRIYFGN